MIKGIAWDHKRCWGPLDASVASYRALTGREVSWDRRSLYSFGEGHLSEFCNDYDLVIYDHPFVGDVRQDRLLHDLTQWLTPDHHTMFTAEAVGLSWVSYAQDGGVWALPIDAAAQTAAWRPDLMERQGEQPPETIDAVHALAARLRQKGQFIGWPAVPTDQMCTFMSVAVSLGMSLAAPGGAFIASSEGAEVIAQLSRLLAVAHPESIGWNPIRCLDHMAAQDDVVYVPYLFNYVNYAGPDAQPRIQFGAPPRMAADQPPRTLLGGAGIGVSTVSKDPEAAFDYAMYLCTPAFQSGDYVLHGGQPGSRAAWTSDRCNDLTGGFLRDTLPVLDRAWLRPTYPGFVGFFRTATHRLAAVLSDGDDAAAFVSRLNDEHARLSEQAPDQASPVAKAGLR
ncbi:MAG: ABC transporter substrate-binding protein [Inquilinaceae bacterium]